MVIVVHEWVVEGVQVHDAAKERRDCNSYVASGILTAVALAAAVSRTVTGSLVVSGFSRTVTGSLVVSGFSRTVIFVVM
jgi:hypothetical protein